MGADMKEENACGFEGFEKRLEVEFEGVVCFDGSHGSNAGLRALSRCELDVMLTAAECTIVSERHNPWFDAYVLSESSLFVYPHRLVLKTCGKTQLLNAIPVLLRQATTLSLKAIRCKYSRGTFIFPDAQPFPYTSFTEETLLLDEHFAPMIAHGCRSAHVLGGHSGSNSSSWHIYTATASKEYAPPTISAGDHFDTLPNMPMVAGEHAETIADMAMAVEDCAKDVFLSPVLQRVLSVYTLEMCMTHLDPLTSSHFMNLSGSKSGADMTRTSGISSLLPNADICDFAFSPCGYSMNGMEEDALSTVHITPEEGYSYASFEVMGYDPYSLDLGALVNRVVACFRPGSLVMSIHLSGHGKGRLECMPSSWDTSLVVPRGYVCDSSVRQELAGGGVVAFHTFTKGARRCGVVPQPLRNYSAQANEGAIDYSCEPSVAFGDPDDALILPCSQQNGRLSSLLGLEDTISEMVGEEKLAECACYSCDSHSGNGNDHVAYAHGELNIHEPLLSSHRSVKHCGVLLTIVDTGMELCRLQECHPYAKVILRLKPKRKGSYVEVCSNVEEMLRKSSKLGLQVIGIVVDSSTEFRLAIHSYEGAVRAAIKVCGCAQALGMAPLKLLAMGPCAATYE